MADSGAVRLTQIVGGVVAAIAVSVSGLGGYLGMNVLLDRTDGSGDGNGAPFTDRVSLDGVFSISVPEPFDTGTQAINRNGVDYTVNFWVPAQADAELGVAVYHYDAGVQLADARSALSAEVKGIAERVGVVTQEASCDLLGDIAQCAWLDVDGGGVARVTAILHGTHVVDVLTISLNGASELVLQDEVLATLTWAD